ncbi:UNVERIFIED_CONTAM: hypothetical protein Sindi_2251700 [Sesamum indicum]
MLFTSRAKGKRNPASKWGIDNVQQPLGGISSESAVSSGIWDREEEGAEEAGLRDVLAVSLGEVADNPDIELELEPDANSESELERLLDLEDMLLRKQK